MLGPKELGPAFKKQTKCTYDKVIRTPTQQHGVGSAAVAFNGKGDRGKTLAVGKHKATSSVAGATASSRRPPS